MNTDNRTPPHPVFNAESRRRRGTPVGVVPLRRRAFALHRGWRGDLCSSVFIRGFGSEPLIALQDVDHAHTAAAHHVAETGAGDLAAALPLDLARAGLAAQLQGGLPELRQAGRAARMAARDEAAVG